MEAAPSDLGPAKGTVGPPGSTAHRWMIEAYDELHRLARRTAGRSSAHHALHPTALLHEAFIRLSRRPRARWDGRAHFFGAAARAMRDVLVERTRAMSRLKRGRGRTRVDLRDLTATVQPPPVDLLDLQDAIQQLGHLDSRKADVVNLRYFAGLNTRHTASALGISVATVKREWQDAKRWLYVRLWNEPIQSQANAFCSNQIINGLAAGSKGERS